MSGPLDAVVIGAGFATLGGHGEFPPAVLADLLAGLGAAIDAVGGTFVMRYTTIAVTAVVSPPV
jgi:hypothetical protein